MASDLRAVVIGAGWAGEGHTKALQFAGVDVVAICARSSGIVRAVADRLGVEQASTDWQQTLERVQPDIVAVATPGNIRIEPIAAATALGAHILCDKPLGRTAAEAQRIHRLVEQAGVKHAFAATHGNAAWVAWVRERIGDGAIGTLNEIVSTSRRSFFSSLMPWSWIMSLELGGGMLNNGLPHQFSALARITGGNALRAMGTVRTMAGNTAPVIPDLHDFRDWIKAGRTLTSEQADTLEWREVDADIAYTLMFEFATPDGAVLATVINGPGLESADEANGMRLYGSDGTLVQSADSVGIITADSEVPRELPIPQRLLDQIPQVGDRIQNLWCVLLRDFVAEIRGEPHQPYLTFDDGLLLHRAIDAIRAGDGWLDLERPEPVHR